MNEPKFAFYKWREDPFMPIEFSAAAFRFGHSMVRSIYRLNTRLNGGDNPNEATRDEDCFDRLIEMANDLASPARQHFSGGILVRRRAGIIEVAPAAK